MMWFNLPDQLEFVGIIIPFLSAKTALYIWLVVLTILKNMKVNGKDYPIYYGKIKKLQTTNQYIYIYETASWDAYMFSSNIDIFPMTNHLFPMRKTR